jgi:UDP-glucose 4-epimerase
VGYSSCLDAEHGRVRCRRRGLHWQSCLQSLAESGYVPVCYDTLEKGHAWAVRWGPLECGDVGNATALDSVLERHRPKAIIHLAGYIEVGESVKRPALYFENNLNKTKILIDAAVRHEIEAFVLSSSCSVNGVPRPIRLPKIIRWIRSTLTRHRRRSPKPS